MKGALDSIELRLLKMSKVDYLPIYDSSIIVTDGVP